RFRDRHVVLLGIGRIRAGQPAETHRLSIAVSVLDVTEAPWSLARNAQPRATGYKEVHDATPRDCDRIRVRDRPGLGVPELRASRRKHRHPSAGAAATRGRYLKSGAIRAERRRELLLLRKRVLRLRRTAVVRERGIQRSVGRPGSGVHSDACAPGAGAFLSSAA